MWTKSEWRAMRRFFVNFEQVCLITAYICLTAAAPSGAQTEVTARESDSSARLLTLEEGRAIVNVAWQQEQPAAGMRDCSHFVHQIYENAGFQYAYASSFEIYAGNDNFERVRNPHPGDLIAWPGHLGIVVDPLQHNFYSLVRAGLAAQDYRSEYWRSRGTPRFYRYKVWQDASLRAANLPSSSRSSNSQTERSTGMNAGLTVEEGARAEYASSDRPPTAVAEKAGRIYGPPVPPVPVVAKNADPPFAIPTSVIVSRGNIPPTREEVLEAISELSDAGGSVLRTDDPLNTQLRLVFVEEFQVERVDLKQDHGWAHLVVDSKVRFVGGEIQRRRHREKVRWELRRTDSGWEAVALQDRRYIPQDVAVKNLSGQLERLTSSEGAAKHQPAVLRQEAQLVGLLNVLLQSK